MGRSIQRDATTCLRTLALLVIIIAVFLPSPPADAQGPPVFIDTFDAAQLDLARWDPFPQGGATLSMGTGLRIGLDGSASFSSARVLTFYRFTGDFDVQIDFRLGSGWNSDSFPTSDPSSHLNGGAIGVYLDEPNWMVIFRSRSANVEGFTFYSNVNLGESPTSQFAPSRAESGSLRIVSSAGMYRFLFDAGAGWMELARVPSWTSPVRVFLNAANVNTHIAFSTTLNAFQINAGSIDYQPFRLPDAPMRRPDFVAGGQFINEVISRWIVGQADYRPMDQLAAQGMGMARGCMTTVSDPDLASTPPISWHTLGWKNSYWSSREMVAQLFKDALAAGMRINTCFYFSDGPADGSHQIAPVAWRNLSVGDTATALELYAYETTTYLLNQGIRTDLYDVGNEILYGILNFRPGDRISVPPGLNFTEAVSYLRASVWPTEATLLTAAIRGIRRADPGARIVLHVETSRTPGEETVYAFFETMRALDVPYDVAGLSLPYADSTDLSGFTVESYFQRWETLVNRLAALGKPVYIAESNYPARSIAGTYPAMPDFPYSDAGQAAYLDSHMRWASNNPNIIGWTWFYPEWYPGISGNTDTPVLDVSGLFSAPHTMRPAVAALTFIPTPSIDLQVSGAGPGPQLSNPITVTYTLQGCSGQEMFLVLNAPAMGLPWSYLGATGWVPLPATLATITPYASGPADGTYTLYTGTVPAGAYDLYLGCDVVPDGHLTLGSGLTVNGVYDYVSITVP